MKVTKTDTKQILVGISISLAIALTGCGGNGSEGSAQNGMNTLNSFQSLSTRGFTTVPPYDPEVIAGSITYNSVDVKFKFDQNISNDDFDGFYLHIGKLPEGYTEDDLKDLTKADWIKILNCKVAFVGKKSDTILENNINNGTGSYDVHHIVAKNLDANTTYVAIPNAYANYLVGNNVLKRDLLCKAATTFTTLPAPLPDPCLNVTGWYNHSNQVFKTRWVTDTFGAHPTWCFMKDKEGKPVFDGANLYRAEKDDTTGTFGTPVLLSATDGVFDTERDFFDCPLEEDGTYRYILEAYNLASDGVTKIYHDKNVTADVTLDPNVIPERDCEYCTTE